MKEKNIERKFVTTGKMTGELIGGFLIYGFLFGLLYEIIITIVSEYSESLILKCILSIVLQGITVYIVWKFSIKSAFKKMTIYNHEVSKVMKNLTIFTIIACLLVAIYNFKEVSSNFDKEINSNIGLTLNDRYASYLYDDDEMKDYKAKKEKVISDAKAKLYGYLAALEIGLLAVYLGVLPLEKKIMLKYTTDANNIEEETI